MESCIPSRCILNIIEALNTELNKILERLEISQITTREFWEKEKQVSLFTMQAIFFIRSIEAIKAHINDEIAQAKMRILIVAPEITDVDLDKLKAIPTHINIRIAANINVSIPEHMDLVRDLDEIHNITYRSRELKNLWGINRDYEEVILCVVSETEIDGIKSTEIAGIGSMLEEHIKIFVPVLEEAWVGAHKDIERTIDPRAAARITTAKPIPKPIITPTKKEAPLPQPPRPVKAPEPLPTPTPRAPAVVKPSVVDLLKTTPTQPTSAPTASSGGGLLAQYDNILNNIEQMTGAQIGAALSSFKNSYTETKGYSGVLKPMDLTVSQIAGIPTALPPSQVKELKNKLNFWKKKLQL